MNSPAFFSNPQHTNNLVLLPEKIYHSKCDRWFKRAALKVYSKTTGETVKTPRNRYLCPVCSQYDVNGKLIAPVIFTGYRAGHPHLTKPYTQENLEVSDHG
jgi:hypothetical protein